MHCLQVIQNLLIYWYSIVIVYSYEIPPLDSCCRWLVSVVCESDDLEWWCWACTGTDASLWWFMLSYYMHNDYYIVHAFLIDHRNMSAHQYCWVGERPAFKNGEGNTPFWLLLLMILWESFLFARCDGLQCFRPAQAHLTDRKPCFYGLLWYKHKKVPSTSYL